MGDISQFHFLKKVGPQTPVRVLEVGSLRSNNAQGFRELFPSADYVGIDMLAGEGVDELGFGGGMGRVATEGVF